jgi:hypothetical protein
MRHFKKSLLFKNKALTFPSPVCVRGSTRGEGKESSVPQSLYICCKNSINTLTVATSHPTGYLTDWSSFCRPALCSLGAVGRDSLPTNQRAALMLTVPSPRRASRGNGSRFGKDEVCRAHPNLSKFDAWPPSADRGVKTRKETQTKVVLTNN